MQRISWRRLLVGALALLAACQAGAQTSGRAIRMVVPFTASGATDVAARVIAAQMSKDLGQPVVVENMGGAGGTLGAAAVAKEHPDKLAYGTASLGSVGHLNTEMFLASSGLTMVSVPYKGSAQLIVDLIAGNVQIAFDTLPVYLPHLQSGRLVALAVNGSRRSTSLPNVPTLLELGYKGFENAPPFAIFAPQGLLPDVAKRLNEAVAKAVAHPDAVKGLQEQGFTPESGGGDEVTAILLQSTEAFRKVIRDANIKLQ